MSDPNQEDSCRIATGRFEHKCGDCGSVIVKIVDDVANYGSCGMGSVRLECQTCGNWLILYDNDW